MTVKSVSRTAALAPGKFEGEPFYTRALYYLSLNGFGDGECGDVQTVGFYATVFRGEKSGDLLRDMIAHPDTFLLRPQDRAELVRAVGAILQEDSQGFVSSRLYTSLESLEEAWEALYATADEQDSDDDDDTSDGLGTYEAGTL
jgi:hypothetical protein